MIARQTGGFAAPNSGDSSTPAYNTLRIALRRSKSTGETYYQATLQQRGGGVIGGPFRPQEMFRGAEVRAIRQSYERQLRVLHELAFAGIPVPPPDERELVELGRRIADVLPATARQGIVASVLRARRQRRGLRIALEVAPDAKELLEIPWELMVLPLGRGGQTDTGGEGFLLLNADVALVRQVKGVGHNTAPALTPPLTLQAFVAAPLDGKPIDVETTRAAIEQVVPHMAPADCWYDRPGTLRALQERLRETTPEVLHLLCHGERRPTGRAERTDLLFTHDDGYTRRVSAFELAPLLTLDPALQLVVLQACHAGAAAPAGAARSADGVDRRDGERDAVESIALALVRQGVPAVVAMQGAITQEAAGTFVRTCYATLARGGSLERAVAAGRIATWSTGSMVDWSLPVVYQGSGEHEPETWYARLADRIFDSLISDSGQGPAIRRGGAVALALVLFTIGVLRWVLVPEPPRPNLTLPVLLLVVWAGVGLVGPAMIAAAHRGVRDREDLEAALRAAALRSQWMGAYLGYGLWGLAGLGLLVVLWIMGLLERLPLTGTLVLFVGILLGALFMSYATARSQLQSALAIAPFDPGLSDRKTTAFLLFATLVTLAIPFALLYGILFFVPDFAFLLNPAPLAVLLALLLITIALFD